MKAVKAGEHHLRLSWIEAIQADGACSPGHGIREALDHRELAREPRRINGPPLGVLPRRAEPLAVDQRNAEQRAEVEKQACQVHVPEEEEQVRDAEQRARRPPEPASSSAVPAAPAGSRWPTSGQQSAKSLRMSSPPLPHPCANATA